MALLSREQVDGAVGRKWEDVPVPEWGEGAEVRIMELSAADRGYIDAGQVIANESNPKYKVESLRSLRQKLVAGGLVDENFKRMYSWKDVNEGKLDDKSAAVIERLASKVQEISGMGKFAVREAEGNSEAGPSDSSDSD